MTRILLTHGPLAWLTAWLERKDTELASAIDRGWEQARKEERL